MPRPTRIRVGAWNPVKGRLPAGSVASAAIAPVPPPSFVPCFFAAGLPFPPGSPPLAAVPRTEPVLALVPAQVEVVVRVLVISFVQSVAVLVVPGTVETNVEPGTVVVKVLPG